MYLKSYKCVTFLLIYELDMAQEGKTTTRVIFIFGFNRKTLYLSRTGKTKEVKQKL